MTEPTPVHGCTIDGQPAMPILVSEYNALVTRATEAEARLCTAEAELAHITAVLAAVLGLFPPAPAPDGPAVRSRHVPGELVERWRGILATTADSAGPEAPATLGPPVDHPFRTHRQPKEQPGP